MRILAAIIILMLLLVFVSCDVVVSANNELPEIYAFVHDADAPHVKQMVQGLKAGAKDLQADLEIHEINMVDEPDKAVKEFKKANRRSTKAIIIMPFENDELYKQLEKARKKGIYLIYLDTVQSYDIPGTYIISDNEKAAKKAGNMLVEAMGHKGEAVILNTSAEDPKALKLEMGLKEALQGYPEIKMVNLFYCNGQRENTKKTLRDILAAHPDIKGVFAACPETAAAAAEAISEWNGEVQIVGFNHTYETLQLINNGQIYGTVSPKFYDMGYEAVKTVVSLISGQDVQERIDLSYAVYTREGLYEAKDTESPLS